MNTGMIPEAIVNPNPPLTRSEAIRELKDSKEYEGIEIWTEKIDSKYVIGGETWTGAPIDN